jgi:hypothetical protein
MQRALSTDEYVDRYLTIWSRAFYSESRHPLTSWSVELPPSRLTITPAAAAHSFARAGERRLAGGGRVSGDGAAAQAAAPALAATPFRCRIEFESYVPSQPVTSLDAISCLGRKNTLDIQLNETAWSL